MSSAVKPMLLLFLLTVLTFMPLLLGLNLPAVPYNAYLPLHTTLELIAVVVAAMIFAIVREQALVKMTLRGAVVACAFFAVFWLDLAHLLSYPGMPAYFSENDPEKTINLWLAARLIVATAICFVVLPMADRKASLTLYYKLLLSAISLVLILHYWLIAHPDTVPRTFIAGQGLTGFKIGVEYLVVIINLLTVALILRYRRKQQTAFHMPALLAAVITMALSEFYFTLYSQFSDSFNIIGHVLKLMSYLFLYRALVYETLAAPYAMLQQSKAELSATLSAVPDILFDVDLEGRFYQVHRRPETILYLEPEQFIGKTAQQVLPEQVYKAMQTAIEQANARQGCSDAQQYALKISPQAEPNWFQVVAALKPTTKGIARFILAVRDITAQKRAQATEQLNALAFHTREAIMITDAEKRIIRVNPAFTDITGYSEAEAIGQKPTMLSSGLHDKAFYQQMWQLLAQHDVWSGEIYNRRKNGEVYPEHVVINALKDSDNQVTHYIASFSDISETKADQQRIHRLAFYDPLTHLPNRRLLLEKIAEVQADCQRSSQYAALLFIDLDHFKRLNDSYGHSYGDELLRQLAKRLAPAVRETDILARPGGDEFILLARLQTKEPQIAAIDAELIGNKLLEAIRQPFMLHKLQYHITASIGIALFNNDSQAIDELMSSADLAMYHSKESGRNQLYFFEQQMQQRLRQRQQLENALKHALANNEFRLYYQPKMDKQGKLAGYEALLRWLQPEQGLIPPDVFIPLAESTGLIIDIGNWVLQTACEQISQLANSGKPLPIAVNVSERQLVQKDFVGQVSQIVANSGINPALLELELTESMLHDDLESTRQKMQALSSLGIMFSLDDFGTGYSSLSYLKKLPIRVLKIDQSFVSEFLSQDTDKAIVRTILAMAEALSLQVVAEGVEQQQQFDALRDMGCDLFQGYLFGKPAPLP